VTRIARTWTGFLVAPIVPAVLLYFYGCLKGYGNAAIVGPALLTPFAYGSALALGVPANLFLRHRGVNGLGVYVALGSAIGVVAVVILRGSEVIANWTSAHEHALALLRNSGSDILVAAIYSAVATACFWLIAVRR
jgi:hypothetical protein